ncbi:MAG: arylsulfatase [Planctomycetota bacterium]|nr:arylsulfatase [Planctomycetota bacterium]
MNPPFIKEVNRMTSSRFVRNATLVATIWLVVVAYIVSSSSFAATVRQKSVRPRDRQPNIVLILVDDLGYGGLGCYGQQKIKTPHIDKLAANGMKFTQAYAGCHVCQPSRCVLMTGMHTGHSAVRANNIDHLLEEHDVTIAEVLHRQGYVNGLFGKWGLGFEGTTGHPLKQGFDEFFGQLLQVHAHFQYPYWVWQGDERFELSGNLGRQREQYIQDECHTRALKFMREHRDEPFFAYVAYILPHVELVVPEDSEIPYRGKFPKIAMPDPRPGYIGSDDGLTTFAGMVSRTDRQVGEIVALLEELELTNDTLVIFTSDNGGQNGGGGKAIWTEMTDYFQANGNLRGYKGTFYEGGVRIPLIASWPGHIPAGTVSDVPIGFWDVTPTLADLVGENLPQFVDGESILPTLLHEHQPRQPRFFYWEYPLKAGIGRAGRLGPWKAVQPAPDKPIELYHLEEDESESKNVAAAHPKIVKQLEKRMNEAHEPVRDFPRQAIKPTVDDFVK